jgi:ubiquinol-cytochrome c reductase cytochrome c1 subunit
MKRIVTLAVGLLLVVAGSAAASVGSSDLRMESAPIDRLNIESLQRGARTFVNYCLNCHTARYMRYNRLTDLGIDTAMIQDNLMFATDKIGETMTVAMTPKDAKAWFGAPPPDLTVEARIRGVDWLYNYFLGFYQDDNSASGWNNLVFPNVVMPHVLWDLQGSQKLVETEFEDRDKAEAAAIAAKGLALVEPAAGGKFVVKTVAPDVQGSLSGPQYETFVADVVNYLDYMAEPVKHDRINIGIVVLIFLGVLFVLVYSLKRDYWKEVH